MSKTERNNTEIVADDIIASVCQVARKHHDRMVLQAKIGALLSPVLNAQCKRILVLEAALSELASVAEACDSWESFPSGALDKAYAVLPVE